MDRLESMPILLTVAEAGSLSAGARRLNTPLTTVSRKISDLESYLKTQLLTRSSRRMTLTDASKSYVAACKQILEEVVEAERIATGEYTAPKGELNITAPTVLGRLYLLPVLSDFLQAYPDIDARLMLVDRLVDLTKEGIDAALRLGDLPDNALIATRIGTIHRVLAASPERRVPHEHRHAPRMFCQVHHGPGGGIAAADHIGVLAAAQRRLAGSRTVIEPATKQLILVGQVEMTPFHAGGADIGAGDQRPAIGKVGPDAIVVERRFHALPHHQNLDTVTSPPAVGRARPDRRR
jgi:DNA-binding transcriptional LysR family regulator